MPTSEPFSRRAGIPLRELLWSSQIDTFPEELRKSESFCWIVRRDDFRSSPSAAGCDDAHDQDYRRLFRRLSEACELNRHELSQLLKPITSTLLTPVLQSLQQEAINIGMRWRNARNRRRWTRSGLEPENLEKSVVASLNRRDTDGTETEIRVGFTQFLHDAGDFADRELREAKTEWRQLEQRIANFRGAVEAVEEGLDEMVPTSALLYAWLQFSIIRENHHGGGGRDSGLDIGPLFFALIINIFSGWRHRSRPFFEELMYFDHFIQTANDEIKYGQARRRQLAQLDHKYGSVNPFEVYGPLMQPADDELIKLIDEHTLVGNEPSPFLRRWQQALIKPPAWRGRSGDPIPFSKKEDVNFLQRSAIWADSSIKRNLGDIGRYSGSAGRPEGWESLDDCCRRIWINDWVKWVVENVSLRGEKIVDHRWTMANLFEFVEAVRIRLTSQGYKIDALSDAEKATLWKTT